MQVSKTTSAPRPDWQFESSDIYSSLADRDGTPYYFYDADTLCRRVSFVKDVFQKQLSVLYAVKANSNLQLLQSISNHIDGLDISSAGELEQAMLAGYDPAKLSFAGPAKSLSELKQAIECGVGSISMESARELRDVVVAAKFLGKPANVSIRINPAGDTRQFGLRMGGRITQFGIEESEIGEFVGKVLELREFVNLTGVHVYAGSQGFDAVRLAEHYCEILNIAEHVEDASGLQLSKLNLGGGFGISHSDSDKELDIESLASIVSKDFQRFLDDRAGQTELMFELGRYLVADCGIYVARVISTKSVGGKKFAITDGGLHHHLAAAGNFGAGFRTNYPLMNISNPGGPEIECSIAGPSCNPTDLLAQDIVISDPREGDLLAVKSSGAYGFTASPILFLGRTTACEYVKHLGKVSVGRPAMAMSHFN